MPGIVSERSRSGSLPWCPVGMHEVNYLNTVKFVPNPHLLAWPPTWICVIPTSLHDGVLLVSCLMHEIWPIGSEENHRNCCHEMSDFKAKMHQIRFRLGLRPTPLGELTALPRPASWI